MQFTYIHFIVIRKELDYYQTPGGKSSRCQKLKKLIQHKTIIEFLTGLIPKFGQIEVQILGKEHKESRMDDMLQLPPRESSALVISGPQDFRSVSKKFDKGQTNVSTALTASCHNT